MARYRYLLGDSRGEAERLRFQARLWDPVSLALFDRLKVRPGMKVLEIGPGQGSLHLELRRRVRGPVDAVERSAPFAERLRRLCEKDRRGRGTIWERDLIDAPLPPAAYDLIFARWVFLFLPEPLAHLKKLARALKPGGRIAIQDYHRESMRLYPTPEDWDELFAADVAFFKTQGGDASIGAKLPGLYKKAGLIPESAKAELKTGFPGSDVWTWASWYFLGVMPRLGKIKPFTPAAARQAARQPVRRARRARRRRAQAPPMIDRWVAVSTAYLGSRKALDSLARDPYWPKWDTPWWHMTLLWEMGRADAIPKDAAEAMLAAMESKYVRFFPNPREPMPLGKDYHRDGMCHCGLGNMYQTLAACGLDLDHRAPWMRAWFLHYQLPDGGLNCDDKVYEKGGSSSIQSTLPVMEAVLSAGRPLTPTEEHFVDAGAEYLLERRLAFRKKDGQLMDPTFLDIGFPRFYDYDVLRGLSFISEWARLRRKLVPRRAVGWIFESLDDRFPDARVRIEKEGLAATESTISPKEDGAWERIPQASTFPLLDAVRKVGSPCAPLTAQWERVKKVLGSRLEG